MATSKEIIQRIFEAKNIAIFAHKDPDPDACGSMLGLREFCRIQGKNADAFCGDFSEYISKIFPMEQFKKDFIASDYDLVVFCDLHAVGRYDDCFASEIQKCKNAIVIDHHIVSGTEVLVSDFGRIVKKASASQMILDLYREVCLTPTKDVATYLYAGLMGDTDRFLHPNLSKEVFEDAIYLLECGAEIQKIYDKMFRSFSRKEITISQYLYSHLNFIANGRVAYIVFTNRDLKRLRATREDVKAFSNSLINIEGVKWSLLICEVGKNQFRFSMRSLAEVDLMPLASKMSGGGHKHSAAFTTKMKKNQIKKAVTGWVDEVLND